MAGKGWVFVGLALAVFWAAAVPAQETMQVAQNAPGFKPEMAYQDFGKGESVNAFNGGLVVSHRSAVAVPENLGGSFQPVRTYNSKSLEAIYSHFSAGEEGPPHGWMGLGWTLSFGRVFLRLSSVENPNGPPAYLLRRQYYYQDETGAEHRLYLAYTPGSNDPYTGIEPYDEAAPNVLPTTNRWYVTNDGSYIRGKYNEPDNPGRWRLYFPDGSTRILGGANAFLAPTIGGPQPGWRFIRNRYQQGWYTTAIRDRAGNVVSIEYRPYQPDSDPVAHPYRGAQPYMGSVLCVSDTLGRVVDFEVFSGMGEGTQKNGLLSAISLRNSSPAVRETYDYASFPGTLVPWWSTCPQLTQVTDPASLQTLYDYGQFTLLDGGSSFSVLRRIDYPTGGSVFYTYKEWTYFFNRCRQIRGCEPQTAEMFGVETRTEFGAPVGGGDNWATWKWDRQFNDAGGPMYGISSQVRVIPVIAVDPLGQQTVHFFSSSDPDALLFPPGVEMAVYTYAPRSAFQKTNPTAGRVGQKDIVYSFSGGDADRCVEEYFACSPGAGWYIGPGNPRTRKTIEGEYTAGASTPLWSKVVQSDVWDGYGHYLLTRTTGTNFSQTWISAQQYDLKLGSNGQPYQLDRLVASYSGTASTGGNLPGVVALPVEPPEPTEPLYLSGQFRAVKQEYQDQTPVANAGLLWKRYQQRYPASEFCVYINPPSLTAPTPQATDPLATLAYDSQGNIASVQYSGGQTGETYTSTFTWSSGMVSQMAWSGAGHNEFTRTINPVTGRIDSETAPDGVTTTGFSYDALGRLITITLPGGEDAIHVAYPTTSKQRSIGGLSKSWTAGNRIVYYKGPLPSAPVFEYPASPAAYLGTQDLYTLYAFDDWGRLGRTDKVMPDNSWSRTERAYDPFGQAVFSSEAFNPASPPSRWVINYPLATGLGAYTVDVPGSVNGPALGTWTSFFGDADYAHPFGVSAQNADPFHRTRWTLRADKSRTQTEYNPGGQGLFSRVTLYEINAPPGSGGGLSSATLYGRDVLGRLLSVVPAAGASAAYTYDGLGNLAGVNLGGQTRSFAYDALGHLTSATNPENGTTVYLAYDALGNLRRYRDARGTSGGYEILKSYDAKGRPVKLERVAPGATSGPLLSEWTYDQGGHGFSAGKVTHTRALREDGLGSVETDLTYDQPAGRLGRKSVSFSLPSPVGSRSLELQYRYVNGQLSEEWFSRGSDFLFKEYSTYAHGALVSKIFSDGQGVQSLAYGVSGALKAVQYSNLTNTSYTQDVMGRTASITAANQASQTTMWASGGYLYDGAGNIRSIGSDAFTYDALSRLTYASVGHAWAGGNTVAVQVGYSYDGFGNLLTRDILNDGQVQGAIGVTEAQALERQIAIHAAIATSGSAPTNRLASVVRGYNSGGLVPEATVVPVYDANGNLTGDGTNTLAYDALNQVLTTAIPSDGQSPPSTEYAFYDAEGERAAVVRYAGAPLALSTVSLYARSGPQVLGEVTLAYTGGQVTGDKAKAYLYVGTNLAATEEGTVAAPASYTITASAGSGGTISPSGAVTVNAGASQTFTITPNGGYRIASVTVDGVNQGAITSYTFSNVTANHTIAAAFTAAGTFTLTVTVGTGATGTPSAGTYTYGAGSVVSYSYAAQAGYTGLTVKLDGVAVAASGTVTMNASHALAVTAAAAGGSYSISGRVTYGGVGQGSVRITCGTKTVYTDTYGNYTVGGLANGSYTVTPYSSGLSFYPVRATVTIAGGNVTGVNFQMGRTVSGTVTLNGAGLGYVTVSTNTGVTATTLSNGTYSLTGLAPATYTVTPSRAGYAFTPASRSVTVGNSNVYAINFTATQTGAPEAGGREATAATPSRGPMRPGEEGVYYGRYEEEGAMPSPGGTEATNGPAGGWIGVPETVTEPGLAEESPAEASGIAPAALQNLTAAFYAWDHLGTIRLVSSADRSVIDRHDYEPYGVELRPILNQTGNTHQFTGHERDQATGYDYMHARYYGSNLARFMRSDTLMGKPSNPQTWNLYAYVQNNPMVFNDPTGEAAWNITNQWNQDYMDKYSQFVADNADSYKDKYTCEDYALAMMIDFASSNGLPMQITTDSGVFDAKADSYSSVGQYKEDVLSHTGAPDLQKSENTKSEPLKDAKPGDLLLKKNDKGTATHVQIVVNAKDGTIDIRQGNSGMLNSIPGASHLGASDPKSWFYTGKEVQKGSYNTVTGTYTRDGNVTPDAINKFHLEARAWNVSGWNQ